MRKKKPTASRTEVLALRERLGSWRPAPQYELARLAGVNQSTISRWARGEISPSEKRLADLALKVKKITALRARLNPVLVTLLDSQIAASDPALMLRECRILLEGADAIYEELLAAASVNEFDTLKAVLDLARGRIAEIKAAIDPLTRVPS